MCSLAVKVYNKTCQELYARMVVSGKAKKVALVTVMNKRFKQVFDIVHSGEIYTSAYLV